MYKRLALKVHSNAYEFNSIQLRAILEGCNLTNRKERRCTMMMMKCLPSFLSSPRDGALNKLCNKLLMFMETTYVHQAMTIVISVIFHQFKMSICLLYLWRLKKRTKYHMQIRPTDIPFIVKKHVTIFWHNGFFLSD